MVRKILAFIVGLVTFFVLVSLIQVVSGLVFGGASREMMADPDAMKNFVAKLPVGAFILLLVGYMVGSFGSGFLMRLISRSDSLWLPLIIGILGTIGWIFNLTMIPHPVWVAALGLFCYIPFAILGHKASRS